MEPASDEPAASWDGRERRHDKVSAERVAVALVFRRFIGLGDAVDYLFKHAVAGRVSQRVLLHPVYRRGARRAP